MAAARNPKGDKSGRGLASSASGRMGPACRSFGLYPGTGGSSCGCWTQLIGRETYHPHGPAESPAAMAPRGLLGLVGP